MEREERPAPAVKLDWLCGFTLARFSPRGPQLLFPTPGAVSLASSLVQTRLLLLNLRRALNSITAKWPDPSPVFLVAMALLKEAQGRGGCFGDRRVGRAQVHGVCLPGAGP